MAPFQTGANNLQHPINFLQTLLHPPGEKYRNTIGVDQNLGHHSRMVRRLPAFRFFMDRLNRGKVQLIDDIRNEICEMIFRQTVLQARWQEKDLIGKIGSIGLGLVENSQILLVGIKTFPWFASEYSDRLLARLESL